MTDDMRPHLVSEGPGEQGVILSPHDDEEQRDVCPLPHAVPVQVEAQTHLKAVPGCVER